MYVYIYIYIYIYIYATYVYNLHNKSTKFCSYPSYSCIRP